MNVTSKGYYTSKYLDNVTKSRYVGLPDKDHNQYDYFSSSQNGPISPRTAMSGSECGSPTSARPRTPVGKTRSPLPVPKTPTQNMNDAKSARSHGRTSPETTSVPGTPLTSPLIRPKSNTSDVVSYDPDYLEQEITPADLHVLQSKNSRVYPYKAHRDMAMFSGKQVRQSANGDYYIKQKQRHDDSPFKPKFYTHKTFKEVFDDEPDSLEKYNPMEAVFDDPETRREQELNQKLKRAFRTIQTKLGKDNYNDYDYYKNRNLSAAQKREIFINTSNNENSNDRGDENDLSNKIYVTEDEKKQIKKNKNFKNVWKNRLKKVSKEISQDYSNNLIRLDELVSDSVVEPIVLEPEEEEEAGAEVVEEVPITNVGSNAEFHPVWNYILSWLVYDQPDEPSTYYEETNNKPKTRMVTKDAAKFDMRNIRNNYKGMINKWGQPASTLFNNKQIVAKNSRKKGSSMKAVPPGILDDLSQEFIIEVDDDYNDEKADKELYFDPTSRQLQAHPPTSFSSMYLQGKFNKQRRNSFTDTSNGPVAIISNINTLIKNIKIMRIIFAPIDIIALNFPNLQTVVIMLELVIFLWLLYELSLLVDALCMMVKAVCAPMIAMGRFMNRIM